MGRAVLWLLLLLAVASSIFVGPIGFVFNILALLAGAGLMAFGFLFSMAD